MQPCKPLLPRTTWPRLRFCCRDGGDYRLRWFTPATEVPLCGHATLASAAVVMERLEPGRTSVVFHSASGPLKVNRVGAGYVMDFPARPSERITPPPGLAEALGADPTEVFANSFNYLALFESAQVLRGLCPDMPAVARLDRRGVIVTAPGEGQLRLPQPLLRARQGHSRGSRNRCCSLHADALLGQSAGQDIVPRLPVLSAWRRGDLPAAGRTR